MIGYLAGLVVLAAIAGPAVATAILLRRRLLPAWRGAPAHTAELVFALGLLTGVPAIAGGFGLFDRAGLIGAMWLSAGVLAVACPRRDGARPRTEPAERREMAAAAAIAALLAGPWLVEIWQAWTLGTTSYDSLNYHLPFAAGWAQSGSTWRIQEIPGLVIPFHPLSGEVLHAVGMVAFRTDLLSPLINVAWLALLATAAWSIGAPHGRGPHCMAIALVVADWPLMVSSQAGSAMTDLPLFAACAAAVAVLVQGVPAAEIAVPMGAAIGLAAGVKLDALAPMAVLFVGTVVLTRPGQRVVSAATAAITALAVGGFWYARDVAITGSPVPALSLPGLPHVDAPVDRLGGFSVAHYLTDLHVVRHYFGTGLIEDFGHWWPVWLAVPLVGIVLALAKGPTPAHRVVALSAVAAFVVYAVTPTSAFGPAGAPTFFGYNLRYAGDVFVTGAVLLPLVARRLALGATALLAVLLLVDPVSWPSGHLEAVGLVLSVAAAVVVLPKPRVLLPPALVAAVVMAAVAQVRWVPHEYRHIAFLSPAMALGSTLHGTRIGVAGAGITYPLDGRRLSNRVTDLGVSGPHHLFTDATTCAAFRHVVNRDGVGVVVIAGDHPQTPLPPEDAWIRRSGAVPIFATPHATAYRIVAPLAPC